MLNNDLKLYEDMFADNADQEPIRMGYGHGLKHIGSEDDRIVALCADLTGSTRTSVFSDEYPERFVQMGIGEQSMASVASGMAAMGKIPFFTSYAMFSPGRNWEQIRTTICYNNSNAKIIGSHAGVSVGPDGGTHQAVEDMGIMRIIPRMTVLAPCDVHQAKQATIAAAKHDGPVYMRFAREATPVITTEETPFEIGKADYYWKQDDPEVTLIACGALVHNALKAAQELAEEGIRTTVVNNHTIKPLDRERIVEAARDAGAVVTVEEHQVACGMGSAVAEILAKEQPTPIEFIGVHDEFGQSGTPEELIEHYGMGVGSIKEAVKRVRDRK